VVAPIPRPPKGCSRFRSIPVPRKRPPGPYCHCRPGLRYSGSIPAATTAVADRTRTRTGLGARFRSARAPCCQVDLRTTAVCAGFHRKPQAARLGRSAQAIRRHRQIRRDPQTPGLAKAACRPRRRQGGLCGRTCRGSHRALAFRPSTTCRNTAAARGDPGHRATRVLSKLERRGDRIHGSAAIKAASFARAAM